MNACGVAPGRPGRLGRADGGVEDRGVVQALLVVVLGRGVAATLLGQHVDHDRAVMVGDLARACSMRAMSWPSMGPM